LFSTSIAVVIPVYNGGAFIHQTLASVVAQSRPVDQVIIVDDCSTDDSLVRVKEWADRLPITVVEMPANGGVSAARNAGLARVESDLVALLDADDIWLPDHVELAAAAHERHGGIISAGAFFWYPGGALRPYHQHLRLKVPKRPERQLDALLERNFVFISSLLRTEDLLGAGGFRSPDTVEDWDLWVRLVAGGLTVTQLERATVLYRRHLGNATRQRAVIIERELALLARFRTELPEANKAAIDRSIRHRRGELMVAQHLEAGEYTARRLPLSLMTAALRGDWRARAKASALLAAPGLARRLRSDRG
jgi:glycosyltransferase involved in cell wall biosynthesis